MASSNSTSGGVDVGDAATVITTAPGISGNGASPNKTVASNAGDTCGCRADGAVRTCFECLNTKLQSGNTCEINPFGLCVDAANDLRSYFNQSYTQATTTNESVALHDNVFFSSSNATYCASDDATCTSCRANWRDAFGHNALRANFSCVGAAGCVCTAYCELRLTTDFSQRSDYNVGRVTCSFKSGQDTSDLNIRFGGTGLIVIGILGLTVTFFLFAVVGRQLTIQWRQRRYNRRMRERRLALRRQGNQTGRFGPKLSLEGWNGYLEGLIEREQESLGLKIEPQLTEESIRVVVQEGEGFRPASPSHLTRQHSSAGQG